MQQYIKEIQNIISCPPKIYSQLYLATLNNFIIHCPADSIKQRLKLTIIALKLRQGTLLPSNAGAEMISAQEAQWTYALFSGSLLNGFQSHLIDMIIPKIAETWLQKNSSLYLQWNDLLNSNANEKNDLNKIIQRAIKKSS